MRHQFSATFGGLRLPAGSPRLRRGRRHGRRCVPFGQRLVAGHESVLGLVRAVRRGSGGAGCLHRQPGCLRFRRRWDDRCGLVLARGRLVAGARPCQCGVWRRRRPAGASRLQPRWRRRRGRLSPVNRHVVRAESVRGAVRRSGRRAHPRGLQRRRRGRRRGVSAIDGNVVSCGTSSRCSSAIRATSLCRAITTATGSRTSRSTGRPRGSWYVRNQLPVRFGDPGDLPVPADYDGDGQDGHRSVPGRPRRRGSFGASSSWRSDERRTSPVPGDYNGDGRRRSRRLQAGDAPSGTSSTSSGSNSVTRETCRSFEAPGFQ